jgi:CRISPR-associated protein Cas1
MVQPKTKETSGRKQSMAEALTPGDLKTILHSKRANLYYLEHCRILVKGGRVEYVTEQGKQSLYWNIPIANTTTILLGTGTSLTQAAMRELAKAGVMVGFCGGGGTPLFAGTDGELDIAWMAPQSEYRPTEYLQHWVRFWFDDALRLQAAQAFQQTRLARVRRAWRESRALRQDRWSPDLAELDALLDASSQAITTLPDHTALLTEEARLSKQLYRLAAHATRYGEFTRSQRGESTDAANRFLDHGNYLAYGLGATATWVLGLPHGLAVLHGKTRRGGLVFDVADLVKDAVILPQAFVSAMRGDNEQEFREACIETLTRSESLDFMIDTLKEVATRLGRLAQERSVPPPTLATPAATAP